MSRPRRLTAGRIAAVLATAALASAGAASMASTSDIESIGPGPSWVNR